jgi:hypothetical protein
MDAWSAALLLASYTNGNRNGSNSTQLSPTTTASALEQLTSSVASSVHGNRNNNNNSSQSNGNSMNSNNGNNNPLKRSSSNSNIKSLNNNYDRHRSVAHQSMVDAMSSASAVKALRREVLQHQSHQQTNNNNRNHHQSHSRAKTPNTNTSLPNLQDILPNQLFKDALFSGMSNGMSLQQNPRNSDQEVLQHHLSRGRTSSPLIDDHDDLSSLLDYQKSLFNTTTGSCEWSACESILDDMPSFLTHLNLEHGLDVRSAAQTRVQMLVVQQLELQLQKEKERLNSMISHLNVMQNKMSLLTASSTHQRNHSRPERDHHNQQNQAMLSPTSLLHSQLNTSLSTVIPNLSSLPNLNVASNDDRMEDESDNRRDISHHANNINNHSNNHVVNNNSIPVLNTKSDQYSSSLSSSSSTGRETSMQSLDPLNFCLADSPARRRIAERSNMDITEEIQRNREFYKNADVRPPFTYASLIRQVSCFVEVLVDVLSDAVDSCCTERTSVCVVREHDQQHKEINISVDVVCVVSEDLFREHALFVEETFSWKPSFVC